jgi:DNA-binding response OmpR family regulator
LLERLHAEAATMGIPVIVVSTSPHLLGRVQEQAARYGGHRSLSKPFDVEELLGMIQALVGDA